MRLFIFLSILLFSGNLFGQSFDEYTIPDADIFYKLRMDVYEDDDYNPYWTYTERRTILALMETDRQEFIVEAEKWVEKFPIDIEMIYVLSIAYRIENDFAMFSKWFFRYMGLIRSITMTGDGMSPETGWEVISTSEEYAIINELNLQFRQQALVGGCDMMSCVDEEGNEVELYFKVNKLFMKMRAKLKPKNEEKNE